MQKQKVIQTLYSGLGGHTSVTFSLLDSAFGNYFHNYLVFYGIESLSLFSKKKLQENQIDFSLIKKKPKRYFSPLVKFYEILKIEKPHVLIIHNSELIYPSVLYRKMKGNLKIIFVEHQHNQTKTRLQWIVSKYASKHADFIVSLSDSYKTELIEKFNKCDISDKIKVIPNGIDVKKFSGVGKKYCRFIGMASRLTDNKDHKTLLKAFAKLTKKHPLLKVKIAGSGNQENIIKELIKKYRVEDNVELLGMLDEDKMVDFFRTIDLYVHATLAETMSTSILQAMACELPVITSDIKNNKLLIDEGETGYFYENRNYESLYEVMKYSVDNFNEAIITGKAARKKVIEQYSNQIMGEGYIKLIESL